MSQANGESGEGNTATSNNMATLVPSDDPSKDDLEQYTQKVELLAEIWPSTKINELIARLVLNTTGTAFQKLQLNREKLMTGDKAGVELLVSLLGGQWGKINLERKYEIVEKALFKCVQRQDESNDSFLARCDVVWSELKAKKIDLDDVHAYIVLRGSLLNTEDKKRVIVESESTKDGTLTVEKVSQAVRMLGTAFFNDLIGQKKSKGKIYDHQAFVTEDVDETGGDGMICNADDVTEDDFLEQLLHDEDEDAILVADYEAAMTETVQTDEDLAAAFSSYTEARKRLSDRFKNRGFWPISSSKGKGKFQSFKGKGKSFNRGPKKSLQQRILESTCRYCGRKGHWKAECPDRQKGNASVGSTSTSAAMTTTAVASHDMNEPNALPMEFMQLPFVQEPVLDDTCMHDVNTISTISEGLRERLRVKGSRGNVMSNNLKSHFPRNEVHRTAPAETSVGRSISEPELIFFASHGSCGILDTGATKSVVGSKLLPSLIESLPAEIQKQLFRTNCDITFRFGNQGTLDSQQALVIPLQSLGLGLKIAIVKGETPLLLSNTLIRTLKASIDTERQVLSSPLLTHDVHLKLSPKGLYMLDVKDLVMSQHGQFKRVGSAVAETFVSVSPTSKKEETPESSEIEADPEKQAKLNQLKSPSEAQQETVVHVTSRCQGVASETSHAEIYRPKAVSHSFIKLAQCAHPSLSNEPFIPHRSCASGQSRGNRSIPTAEPGRDGRDTCDLRQNPCGKNLRGAVESGERMDQMVLQDVSGQHKGRTPQAVDLCREEGGASRTGTRTANFGGTSSPTRDRSTSQQGHAKGQVCIDSSDRDSDGGRHEYQRGDLGTVGCDPANGWSRNDFSAGEHWSFAGTSSQHRERLDGDSHVDPPSELSGPVDPICMAGDFDWDFRDNTLKANIMNQRQRTFNKHVQQISQELQEVSDSVGNRHEPVIQVLEVFCGPQSELTKQTNQLGYRACRFGLQEGDLATTAGRKLLFQKVITCRPQHLWYSPTCGPWCSWSHLNEARSEAGFQQVQQERDEHLYQLALGLVLYRHQQDHCRHMHWEQPARSIMLRTPMLHEVTMGTKIAQFDMCKVGAMRDPQNQMLYKKGMEIATTSQQFYFQLHGRFCNKQHEHQQLCGETVHKGHRLKRTEFSENYSRKFSRTVAKVLTSIKCIKEKPFPSEAAFAAVHKRPSRTPDGSQPKRAKLRNSELIEPSQMPAKRRRLREKSTEEINMPKLCESICTRIMNQAPRVGRKEIHDSKILEDIQTLFHDKKVIRIMICKGTERTVVPPKDMVPEEAPFRRAIIIQRVTKKIQIEDEWEEWKYLSARQQWRRSHPSFLNITVFARNHDLESASDIIQPAEPASATQSPTLERSSASNVPEANLEAPSSLPSPNVPEVPMTPSQVDEISQDHGPKFLSMSAENRRLALRMHKNLGHPEPAKLSKILQQRGYSQELSQGIMDLKCSVCQMQQRPKLQRPSTLKEELEFGDKIAMEGVKWTNKQGQEFHFYHFIDYGTNYHTAMIAPNRAEAQERLISGWLNWAGPPNEILLDSATEFLSQQFVEFLQSINVRCQVIPPDAHWQLGRIERHGGVLQHMLSKYELEHDVTNYQLLQQALTQCTMAKNACSLKQGYSPETLVFGRGLRVPGSIVGDDTLPAHARADSENQSGIRFRDMLAKRETARKAFHAADNDMALRRATLRRDRPHRGAYSPGEWVMVWKNNINKGSWIGPAKVIIQDGNNTVFCNNMGSIVRAAPEHIRPVSAVEARLIPLESRIQAMGTQSGTRSEACQNVPREDVSLPNPNTNNSNQSPENQHVPETSNNQRPSSQVSSEQPDQEPDNNSQDQNNNNSTPNSPEHNNNNLHDNPELQPHEIPVPDTSSDELFCDLLVSVDDDNNNVISPDGQDVVWRAELEFSREQLNAVCHVSQQPSEEELVFLATASKKQRTEVKLSTLDPAEKKEFELAKTKEVNNWLPTGTVARMFRHELAPEQVLKCRWLYVWKPVTEPADQKANGGKSRVAKARLVVLGYQDPQLDTIPRDSPTLGRTSKMLIAQVIASMHWTLMSFDIKAAFLQGRTQENRVIAIEPVPEMVDAMNLKPNEVCRLVKSAYGLIDAPFLWFSELDKTLRSLNFLPSPFDPCLYLYYHDHSKGPSGILGVHVNDGLCGGDEHFQKAIHELEKKFPFGAKKSQNFVFTGIDMNQQNDHSIVMSQEKYITKINPIHIQPERKAQLELPVTERERQDLRALIGSLQYASVNTRPDLASRLSFLQSDINKATIETLIQANKTLHEAKRHKETSIKIQPIPMDKIRFLAFSDASFASKRQPESHTGTMIMTTHENIGKNHVCVVNPISWGCKKIQRVVTSTLSAETTSLNTTLDQLSWLRLFWSWIRDPQTNWKNPTETLKKLPETFATATFKEDPAIAITDCKSLYDLVTRTAPPQCQEYRTQLQARAIKDLLAEGVTLR